MNFFKKYTLFGLTDSDSPLRRVWSERPLLGPVATMLPFLADTLAPDEDDDDDDDKKKKKTPRERLLEAGVQTPRTMLDNGDLVPREDGSIGPAPASKRARGMGVYRRR